MEHFHHHTKYEIWNWDDTEARLLNQEKILAEKGPAGFHGRVFFW